MLNLEVSNYMGMIRIVFGIQNLDPDLLGNQVSLVISEICALGIPSSFLLHSLSVLSSVELTAVSLLTADRFLFLRFIDINGLRQKQNLHDLLSCSILGNMTDRFYIYVCSGLFNRLL